MLLFNDRSVLLLPRGLGMCLSRDLLVIRDVLLVGSAAAKLEW